MATAPAPAPAPAPTPAPSPPPAAAPIAPGRGPWRTEDDDKVPEAPKPVPPAAERTAADWPLRAGNWPDGPGGQVKQRMVGDYLPVPDDPPFEHSPPLFPELEQP